MNIYDRGVYKLSSLSVSWLPYSATEILSVCGEQSSFFSQVYHPLIWPTFFFFIWNDQSDYRDEKG